MTEPMKTALAGLTPRTNDKPMPTAAEIDKTASMPRREGTVAAPARRRIKAKAQIGVTGDASIIQRFVDYADQEGLQYVEAIETLMDKAGA